MARTDTTGRLDRSLSRRVVQARLATRISRAVAVVIGLVALAIAALYHGVLRDPKRMGALVQARLQEVFGRLDLVAGDVDLRPLEGYARVQHLRLGASGQVDPIAACRAVEVRFSPGSPFTIREVRLVEPELVLEAPDGTWNFARLFPEGMGAAVGVGAEAPPRPAEPPPIVHLDRGRIVIRDAPFLAPGRSLAVGPISVRADPTAAPGTFALTGTVEAPGLGLARLSGRVSVDDRSLELSLTGVGPCSVVRLAALAEELAPEWAERVRRAGPVAGKVRWSASLAWADDRLVRGQVELLPTGLELESELTVGVRERIAVVSGGLAWTYPEGVSTPEPLLLEALGARWRLQIGGREATLSLAAGASLTVDGALANRLERASGVPLDSRWGLRGRLAPGCRAAWPEGGPLRLELVVAAGELLCTGIAQPWRKLAGEASWADSGELAGHLSGELGAGTLGLRVQGKTGDGPDGDLRLDVDARSLDLGPAFRPPLGEKAESALARAQLAGTADVASHLSWRGGALVSQAHAISLQGVTAVVGGARVALATGVIEYDGAVARMRGLELRVGGPPSAVPADASVAILVPRGEVELDGDRVLARNLELSLLGGRVVVRQATVVLANGAASTVDGELVVEGVELAALAALPWIPGDWAERLQPVAPRGRLGGALAVSGAVDDVRVTGTLELTEGRFALPGVTAPVEVGRARFAIAPGTIELESAEVAMGESRATLRGRSTLSAEPAGTAVVAFDPFVLGERWQYELGGADVVRYVGELRPEGRARGQLSLAFGGADGVRLDGGEATLYRAAIQLLEYDQRLDDIAGTVEIPAGRPGPDGSIALVLRDASGRIGGRSFSGAGEIRVGGRGKLGLDLSFWCAAVPASEWIRLGLDTDMAEAYEEFDLEGTIDLRVDVLRRHGERVVARIVLEATGGIAMRFADFPVRVEGVRARLEISRGGIFVQQLRGHVGEAVVTASGTIRAARPHNMVELAIQARGARFDGDLRAALADEYREIWDLLGPTGEFGLDLSLSRSDSTHSKLHHRLVIFPRRVRLSPFGHPLPGDITEGQVLINPRRVDAVGIVSRIGNQGRLVFDGVLHVLEPPVAPMAAHSGEPIARVWARGDPLAWARLEVVASAGGAASASERAELRFDCRTTAERVVVDRELVEALGSWEPGIAARLEPAGQIATARLSVRGHRGASGATFAYDGAVAVDGLSLGPSLGLSALCGAVELSGRRYEGVHLARGRVHDVGARLLGGALEDGSADVVLAGGYLSVAPLRARFAGGALSGRCRLDMSPAKTFQFSAHLEDADLSRLALGQAEGEPVSGALSGGVELAGMVGDPARLAGRGHFVVRDGMLWRLPPFMRLLDLFDLKQPGAFDAGELGITLSHGRFRLDPIAFGGPALALVGEGQLDFDGRIEATLTTTLAPATIPELPIVSRLWRELKRNVVPVRVGGTLAEPSVGFGPIPLLANQR